MTMLLLNALAILSFICFLQTLWQLKIGWREFWDDHISKNDQLLAQRLAIFALLPLGVLLHEVGHALATWQLGGAVSSFQWRFSWGYIIPKGNFSALQHWWIALSGNLISALLVLLSLLLIPRVRKRIVAEILFFFACAQAITGLISYPAFSLSMGWGDWVKIYDLSFQPYAALTFILHIALVAALWRLYHGDPALHWRLARNPDIAFQHQQLKSNLQRNPADLKSHLAGVELLWQQNEIHAARRMMRDLPKSSSNQAAVKLMRACLAIWPKQAIRICQSLPPAELQLSEQILWHRVLSYSYLQIGKLTTALNHADHGISLAPQQSKPYINRARIYLRLRDSQKGLTDLQAAIDYAETEDLRRDLERWINKIKRRNKTATKPLKTQHLLLAGLGFIPILGLPFSLITVAWGFKLRRRFGLKLLILGLLGPVLSLAVLIGSLIFIISIISSDPSYQIQPASLFQLARAAESIESSMRKSGEYPAALKDISDGPIHANGDVDPQPSKPSGGIEQQPILYYQRLTTPSGYYLFLIGDDRLPFTVDDVLLPKGHGFPGYRYPPKR